MWYSDTLEIENRFLRFSGRIHCVCQAVSKKIDSARIYKKKKILKRTLDLEIDSVCIFGPYVFFWAGVSKKYPKPYLFVSNRIYSGCTVSKISSLRKWCTSSNAWDSEPIYGISRQVFAKGILSGML